jgi:hypothetical protein
MQRMLTEHGVDQVDGLGQNSNARCWSRATTLNVLESLKPRDCMCTTPTLRPQLLRSES